MVFCFDRETTNDRRQQRQEQRCNYTQQHGLQAIEHAPRKKRNEQRWFPHAREGSFGGNAKKALQRPGKKHQNSQNLQQLGSDGVDAIEVHARAWGTRNGGGRWRKEVEKSGGNGQGWLVRWRTKVVGAREDRPSLRERENAEISRKKKCAGCGGRRIWRGLYIVFPGAG